MSGGLTVFGNRALTLAHKKTHQSIHFPKITRGHNFKRKQN